MAPRRVSLGGLRPLALAAGVAAALLAPVGLSAQAAEDPAPPPVPPQDVPVPEAIPPAPPAPPQAPAPPPQPPAPQAAAVTVSRATASASESVSIVDFAFKPPSLTVNVGDTVRWTNNGKVPEGHDVTGDGLDSGLLESGESYSHTFDSAGSFSYICTIHPSMKGSVEVLARSGSDGSAGSSGDPAGTGTTASGTEAEAIASPGAAGTATSLPATGSGSVWLLAAGLALLDLGIALRVLWPSGPGRHA